MATKPIGVVRFLGTNCDRDIYQAVEEVGLTPQWLWYEDQFSWKDFGAVILPGGFSYGDYIRSGALAAKAPVMKSVSEAADGGLPILGVCNGFQILCDAKILPGALLRNKTPRFIDDWVSLKLANANSFFGAGLADTRIPVAHGEGRFYIDEDSLKGLEDRGQIWLQYQNNPNGSICDIAGVMNETKNVVGLMPHPERAMFPWMGTADGRAYFETLVDL